MKKWLVLLASLAITELANAAQQLHAVRVESSPTIDGRADDAIWTEAQTLTTVDAVGKMELVLKAIYTDTHLYVLVSFQDDNESRAHKDMLWDAEIEAYKTGLAREDTVVLKWNIESETVDLSLSSDAPYRADIWYWKAARTDHAGYADEKMHVYEAIPSPDARPVTSKSGAVFYIERPGDDGRPAYAVNVYGVHAGDVVPKYEAQVPTGSRGDVQAKGHWENDEWTIEFARRLDTGNGDDVSFDPALTYQFGVSRYEIAGRRPDNRASAPYHGAGKVGEQFFLVYR